MPIPPGLGVSVYEMPTAEASGVAAIDQDFGDRDALLRGVAACDRLARMAIPVRRIRKITFNSMQPSMHPRSVTTWRLLSEFMGLSPIAP